MKDVNVVEFRVSDIPVYGTVEARVYKRATDKDPKVTIYNYPELQDENVLKDIQNNSAKSVDKICSDFLDGFDKCLYEKNSIDFDEKCFKQDFSRQVYVQCILDA